MGVTIKDVAKAAGVAPSTVSRVIADSPRISPETKRKVKKLMKQMGYHPNVNARNLASRSTQTLGIVMPFSADKSLQNPFFPEVLRGISSIAHKQNYSISISTGETDQEILDSVERMVYGNRIDGVILLYSQVNDPVFHFLLEKDFPFVIVGKPTERTDEITHVDNDNVKSGSEITKHLIDLGHKRIGFIGGSPDLMVTVDRLKGYQEALKAASLPILEEYKVHAEFLKSGGKEAVHQLFQLSEPPTGLVIADDLMAVGVTHMLEELSLRVPEDVSIVSFNNVYLSEITRPPLTTVDIHIFDIGCQAARCIIEKVKNKDEPAKRMIIPYSVVHRSSAQKIEKQA
ncbi:LacI family DNA-binding transcriptional regulator [Halobacillus massiliensis]|uniref:LacI family DNA-binding transcriptional regulator n=1 Tax=Halobacillus massiliensis TaxID=1926286 RepID=UPI0009E3EC05|nr:LacI family DNA-binding transcriptional regulator [Halobacillus massiliensis]